MLNSSEHFVNIFSVDVSRIMAAILVDILCRLKTLLDLGSSANYKDKTGLSPLYVSVTSDVMSATSQRCVDMLLYDHASLGIMDFAGWTELHQVHGFTLSAALYDTWSIEIQGGKKRDAIFNDDFSGRIASSDNGLLPHTE